jgi:hypothetical protein
MTNLAHDFMDLLGYLITLAMVLVLAGLMGG